MKNSKNEQANVDNEANYSSERVFSSVEKMQSAVMRYIDCLADGEVSENKEFISKFCGRDSVASTLVKLCQLQLQLIKVENETALKVGESQQHELEDLKDEDWELLARALELRKAGEAMGDKKETKARYHIPKKWFRSKWNIA